MDSKLLTGTVDMLILQVLTHGDSYGYQITQTVLAQSRGQFELKEGSLYPALHRLERQNHVEAYWIDGAGGRRRKYYRLTPSGQSSLAERRESWSRFSAGIDGVLGGSRRTAPGFDRGEGDRGEGAHVVAP